MSRSTANLLLLLAGLTWGMGFVAQQTAMQDIGPMLFIGLRFLLATLAVLPFALHERQKNDAYRKPLTLAEWWKIVPVGISFFLLMALQQVGLLGTTVTNAGILTGLYVVFVPLIVFVVLRKRQPFLVWPAAIASLAGIWLLGGGSLDGLNWGDWLVVGCAIFSAIQIILLGSAVQAMGRPVLIATAQFGICGVLGIVCFLVARMLDIEAEPAFDLGTLTGATPEIVYAACIAGAFAFTLQAVGQRYTDEATAAVLLSSEALFAGLFGAIFLAERLMITGYLGCFLIFAAIITVSWVSGKQAERAETATSPS